MSQQEIDHVNNERKQYLLSKGINNFLLYTPFSDSYWKQDIRILMCNLEPYDIKNDNIGQTILTSKYYEDTILSTQTGKKTAIFLTSLIRILIDNADKLPSYGSLQSLFKVNDANWNDWIWTHDTVSIMNARNDFSEHVDADEDSIKKNCNDENYLKYMRDYFKAIEADVIIITSELGSMVLNHIYQDLDIKFDEEKIFNGKVFVSMHHPSRAAYEYLVKKIEAIVNIVKKI